MARSESAAPKMSERQLRDAVVSCARLLGYRAYWTWNSKHSPAGYPDLCLAKGSRLIFAELKVGKRKPTPDQLEWLAALSAVPGVEAFVWYDAHWLNGDV